MLLHIIKKEKDLNLEDNVKESALDENISKIIFLFKYPFSKFFENES